MDERDEYDFEEWFEDGPEDRQDDDGPLDEWPVDMDWYDDF